MFHGCTKRGRVLFSCWCRLTWPGATGTFRNRHSHSLLPSAFTLRPLPRAPCQPGAASSNRLACDHVVKYLVPGSTASSPRLIFVIIWLMPASGACSAGAAVPGPLGPLPVPLSSGEPSHAHASISSASPGATENHIAHHITHCCSRGQQVWKREGPSAPGGRGGWRRSYGDETGSLAAHTASQTILLPQNVLETEAKGETRLGVYIAWGLPAPQLPCCLPTRELVPSPHPLPRIPHVY